MLHLMESDHWPGFKVKHMDLVWLVLAYKTLSLVHFQLPDVLNTTIHEAVYYPPYC